MASLHDLNVGDIVLFDDKTWKLYYGKKAKVVGKDLSYIYIVFLDKKLSDRLGWTEQQGGGFYPDVLIKITTKLDKVLA